MRYIKQYIVILYEQYIQILVPVHIHIGYVHTGIHVHVVSANSPMTTKVSQIYYPNDYAYTCTLQMKIKALTDLLNEICMANLPTEDIYCFHLTTITMIFIGAAAHRLK